MATGDTNNILGRLQSLLPSRWFTGSTPILNGLLTGIASLFAGIYSLYAYAVLQTRIATATDAWLDLVSGDYFGTGLPRLPSETDTAFRARIQASLFVQRVTRPAMVAALTALTGNAPLIWELNNTGDMAVLGTPGVARGYLGVGRLGSMSQSFNVFITVYVNPIVSNTAPGAMFFTAPKFSALGTPGSTGYFGSLASQASSVTSAAIYALIESMRPAGVTTWVAIKNYVNQTPLTLTDHSSNTVLASVGGTLDIVVVLPPPN